MSYLSACSSRLQESRLNQHRRPQHAIRAFVFLLCLGVVAVGTGGVAHGAVVEVEDFEDLGDCFGFTPEAGLVQEGTGAGGWPDTVAVTSVGKNFSSPMDLSSMTHFGVWIHSSAANGARIQILFDSENPATSGWDYYRYELLVDWTGWRWLWLPKSSFSASREPIGWHEINDVRLSSSGWNTTPLSDTALVLDKMIWAWPMPSPETRTMPTPQRGFSWTMPRPTPPIPSTTPTETPA